MIINSVKPILKKILKPAASASYAISKNKYEDSSWLPGVSAVMAARNESYNLPIALESLIGFADQIICVDNGSTDDSLMKMKTFQEKFSSQIPIEVIEAPGKLLGECKNIGLAHSKYNWHLRWDADMVFRQNTGQYNSAWLKEKIMKIKWPTAFRLARINLSGDFHHVSKLFDVVDDGEAFLVKRTKDMSYNEDGRFDVLRIPLFYDVLKIPEPIVYHLTQLKAIERILYRNEFVNWRQSVNNENNKEDLETFRKGWDKKVFGTDNRNSVIYRFHKKFVLLYSAPLDMKLYGPYPEQIQKAIDEGNERYWYEYQNGIAIARRDKEDDFLDNYIPTKEDLAWDVIAHLKNILSEKEQQKIGI